MPGDLQQRGVAGILHRSDLAGRCMSEALRQWVQYVVIELAQGILTQYSPNGRGVKEHDQVGCHDNNVP
jgi:hypothetical protein